MRNCARRCGAPGNWNSKTGLLRAEGMPEFIAGAPSMQPVLELIAQVGPSDANVLITGEHGTGKEIVARLLHAASPRARMALVAVNAGRAA